MGSPISGFTGAPPLAPSLSSNVASPASTGLSGYAADLQNALNRSVGLAALPLTLLQNQQSQLSSQSTALNSLDLRFSVLQSTISNLNSASQNLLSSSVSDQTVINASTAAGALPGTDRKSTRLNSSHGYISYAVFCLKKKKSPTIRAQDHFHHPPAPLAGQRRVLPCSSSSWQPSLRDRSGTRRSIKSTSSLTSNRLVA